MAFVYNYGTCVICLNFQSESLFQDAGSVTDTEITRIRDAGYVTNNVLRNVINAGSVSDVEDYTLTIDPTPADATVTFKSSSTNSIINSNSITAPRNTKIDYNISKIGYASEEDTEFLIEDKTVEVELAINNYTLTVNTTPSDATVTFSTGSVSGNTCIVPYNTAVTYTVSRTGYNSFSQTITVTNNTTHNITLIPLDYTLTVNPTYSAATVTFNTSGTVSGNSITVPYNTVVSYTLSAPKHDTRTLTETVTANTTVTPQIKASQITPSYYYSAGAANNTTTIADPGQCVEGGTYTYSRGNQTCTWNVTVNERGELQRITASGGVINTTAGGPTTTTPTGGWRWLEIWD